MSEVKQVTAEFRVDQYDRVFDSSGLFFCTWDQLSKDEQETIKLNPFSAR